MSSQVQRRFPITFTQLLVGIAIIVGFFMAFGLNQNAASLQGVQDSEATFEKEVQAQQTIQVQLEATLAYATSEAYIDEFNRSDAGKIVDGEVRIVPLIIQATPRPTPAPTPTPDAATYAQPWQMWWYLLTDSEAPVRPPATPVSE